MSNLIIKFTSACVKKCIGNNFDSQSINGKNVTSSGSSLLASIREYGSIGTRALKCPRVYPSAIGDLIQKLCSQNNGK